MNEVRIRAWLRSLRMEQHRQAKAIEKICQFGMFEDMVEFKRLPMDEWKELVDSQDTQKKFIIDDEILEAPETPEEGT